MAAKKESKQKELAEKKKAEATQATQKSDAEKAKDSSAVMEVIVGNLVTTKASKKKTKYDNQTGEVVAISKNHYKVLLKTGESAGEHHRFEKANMGKKEKSPAVKRPQQSEVSDADGKR